VDLLNQHLGPTVMDTLRNKVALPGADVVLRNDCLETLKNDEMKFFGDPQRNAQRYLLYF